MIRSTMWQWYLRTDIDIVVVVVVVVVVVEGWNGIFERNVSIPWNVITPFGMLKRSQDRRYGGVPKRHNSAP